MRLRHLGLFGMLLGVLLPAPAEAQGDFIKDTLTNLIRKSGISVSMSTRTSIDNDVDMGPSVGIGYRTASLRPRTGRKFPFSFSSYSGDFETADNTRFGRFKARQLMSGIGYQWVRGRTIYSTQVGLGYSFNSVTLDPGVAVAFGVPEPVGVSVSHSFVVRPQAKAEYFLHRTLSVRAQVSYTYTDPDVVIHTTSGDLSREWAPHHVHVTVGLGVFPFRR